MMTMRYTLLCVLLLTAVNVSLSQKFEFPSGVQQEKACGVESLVGTWSIEGSLSLNDEEIQYFDPRVSIETESSKICTIDISKCVPASDQMPLEICICHNITGSGGDQTFELFIRRQPRTTESDLMVKAVMTSRDSFNPATEQTNIGKLPVVYDSVSATYNVNNNVTRPLVMIQNTTVTPNQYTNFKFCAKNVLPESILKISLEGQEVISYDRCVDVTKAFDFTGADFHEVVFSYEETHGCKRTGQYMLYVEKDTSTHSPTGLSGVIPLQNTACCPQSCAAPGFPDISKWGPPIDGKYLAFRGTAGVGRPIYEAYTGTAAKVNIEPCCRHINGSLPCSGHYRNNAILDSWENIEEVTVALYEKGDLKQSLTFNAVGTDYISWFSPGKLTQASPNWHDLIGGTTNFFSVAGHRVSSRHYRSFYINREYNGCPNDYGWLHVMDSLTYVCSYEQVSSIPQFLYSKGPGAAHWSDSSQVAKADVFAIWVKPFTAADCKAN